MKEGVFMAKIYSRVTKLNDVSGRSDYISNPERQEYLKLHGKSRNFDWKEYADFEKKNQKSHTLNNEARELVISLPNELGSEMTNQELGKFSHDLAKSLLGNFRDYEFALHHSKKDHNFHMHLIFSEREIVQEKIPKLYRRDIWYDKDTNRMAKANAKNSELRYKKGEFMKDKEGNIRYNNNQFTAKDKKFTEKTWLKDHQKNIQKILEDYNYKLRIFNPKIEVAQKKLYKGSSQEYLEYAKFWNYKAEEVNKTRLKQMNPLLIERQKLMPLLKTYSKYDPAQIRRAEINLKVYAHNGYSGIKWNIAQRTKYLAFDKFRDETDVKIFEETEIKMRRLISDDKFLINNLSSNRYQKYFELLIDKIKSVQDKFLNIKNRMYSELGSLKKYKNYTLIQERKARELARQKAEEKRLKTMREIAMEDKRSMEREQERVERERRYREREKQPKKKKIIKKNRSL